MFYLRSCLYVVTMLIMRIALSVFRAMYCVFMTRNVRACLIMTQTNAVVKMKNEANKIGLYDVFVK